MHIIVPIELKHEYKSLLRRKRRDSGGYYTAAVEDSVQVVKAPATVGGEAPRVPRGSGDPKAAQ